MSSGRTLCPWFCATVLAPSPPSWRWLRCGIAAAQEPTKLSAAPTTQALAKQAQNPIANLISVPLQNNSNFNYGPRERTQNMLNFEPVIPIKLNEDWNLITRTIVPIIHQPSLAKGESSENGIGDINPTPFFATEVAKDVLVGFGPTVSLPTASQDMRRRASGAPTPPRGGLDAGKVGGRGCQ